MDYERNNWFEKHVYSWSTFSVYHEMAYKRRSACLYDLRPHERVFLKRAKRWTMKGGLIHDLRPHERVFIKCATRWTVKAILLMINIYTNVPDCTTESSGVFTLQFARTWIIVSLSFMYGRGFQGRIISAVHVLILLMCWQAVWHSCYVYMREGTRETDWSNEGKG